MSTVGNLTFHEYNDEEVFATLYDDAEKTIPLNLTGTTVEFIYKTNSTQTDVAAITLPCTILSPTAGTIKVVVSDTIITLDKRFFRIDVVQGTNRRTAVYGTITVVDL